VNLRTVIHRITQGCGDCLPLLLMIGLLIPGCAGKRSDMLSSSIEPKQDAKSGAADGNSAGGGDASSLIAGADSKLDNSQVSAFSAEEIIEGRPRLGTRVRSWFTRDDAALVAGDPFLNDETPDDHKPGGDPVEERKASAGSETSTGEQSLASYQTPQTAGKEPISDVKPWWQTGDSVQDRAAVAGSNSRRVDELLAAFPTNRPAAKQPDSEPQPWWEDGTADDPQASGTTGPTTDSLVTAESPKTTFSRQFDSRLERLRAELNLDDASVAAAEDSPFAATATAGFSGKPQAHPQEEQLAGDGTARAAAGNAAEEFNPFALAGEPSHDLPIVAGNGETTSGQVYPSLMTQPRQPGEVQPAETGIASAGDTDAGARVRTLMDEAQQDWQAWRLERAYEAAVAAHELAAREDVQFLEGEERPRDLVEKIASDLQQDTIGEEPSQAFASNLFQNTDESETRSAGAPFGFEQLERLSDSWAAGNDDRRTSGGLAETKLTESARPEQGDANDTIVASTSSGVSLLPPDDDFPSDAEGRDWDHADPRDIRLANHRFPEFSRPGDQQIREQMRGLSAEDNQALLRNVADQRNRVLTSKGIQWPELPAAHQPAALTEHSGGPIHVAQAPRYTLADDMAIAAAPASQGESATPAGGGSLLGQFWHSQPIWFIGGLILLVVALRLLPWPKKEDV
jgi:hypothetical protein